MSVNLTSFVQLRGIKRDTAIKERKEQARQIDEDISKKGGRDVNKCCKTLAKIVIIKTSVASIHENKDAETRRRDL